MNAIGIVDSWIRNMLMGRNMYIIPFEWDILKENLSSGVDLSMFVLGHVDTPRGRKTHENADKNNLSAQAAFVLSALGYDRMRLLVLRSLGDVITRPGCKILKPSDKKEGKVEPTTEEIEKFVNLLFVRWTTSEDGFKFSPLAEEKKLFWADIVIYRIEAIISVAYVMLRLMSYEDGWKALEYQWGGYFNNNFLVRLMDGYAKALKSLHEPIPEYLIREDVDTKFIRHLHPSTLTEVIAREIFD